MGSWEDSSRTCKCVKDRITGAGRALEKIDIEFDRLVRTVASVFLKTARDNVGVDTSDRAIALDGVEDDFILAARAVFGKRNSPGA